jgi:hypothetical protein
MKNKTLIIIITLTGLSLGLGYYYWYTKYWEPSNIIKYSDNFKLEFDDFKGQVDHTSTSSAHGIYRIFFRWRCRENKFTYKVYSYMEPNNSWMIDEEVDEGLIYQRMIFKATELYARKIRRKLSVLETPCDLSAEEIERISYYEYHELDRFTDHIRNDIIASGEFESKYIYWERQVDSLLVEYNDFKVEGNLK